MMLKVRKETIDLLEPAIAEFCEVVSYNCMVYAFYRGRIYCNSNDNICVDFLGSLESGSFRKPTIEYDPSNGTIYYSKGSRFEFENELVVQNTLKDLVKTVLSLNIPISQLYFDFCDKKHKFTMGCAEHDEEEAGSLIFYLITDATAVEHFDLPNASKACGDVLSTDWHKYLEQKDKLNKQKQGKNS